MNTYRYTFAAECPANGESIVYALEIRSTKQIMVEHIKTACALHKRGYHEAIADDLLRQFGGTQRLIANHHGVTIETDRAAPPSGERPSAPAPEGEKRNG